MAPGTIEKELRRVRAEARFGPPMVNCAGTLGVGLIVVGESRMPRPGDPRKAPAIGEARV
jgi:hypothetical protein